MDRILLACISAWKLPKRRERVFSAWMAEVGKYPQFDAVLCLGVPQLLRPERVGKLLFLPCPDSYQWLPWKVREVFRWAVAAGYAGLWKIDDDTRLDVGRLAAYGTNGADYLGHPMLDCEHDGRPLGNRETEPGMLLYASGGGYWLSHRAAAIAAERQVRDEGFEDLLLGETMRESGIPLAMERRRMKYFAGDGEQPGPGNDWIYATPAAREPE